MNSKEKALFVGGTAICLAILLLVLAKPAEAAGRYSEANTLGEFLAVWAEYLIYAATALTITLGSWALSYMPGIVGWFDNHWDERQAIDARVKYQGKDGPPPIPGKAPVRGTPPPPPPTLEEVAAMAPKEQKAILAKMAPKAPEYQAIRAATATDAHLMRTYVWEALIKRIALVGITNWVGLSLIHKVLLAT